MMFASPRVIAIDDEARHLSGLATSLNNHGVACLQIHFTNELLTIQACRDVRVIFADLHLGGGTLVADPTTDFAVIGDLLENTIKPAGPYFMLLWTMYPRHAADLQRFLDERVHGVATPFAVVPLAKGDYLDGDGNVRSEHALMARIMEISATLPPVRALFDWERRVLEATGQTVSSVLDLAGRQQVDARVEAIGRILRRLAVASAGRDHVDDRRFGAVNEALLPILADRIANLRPIAGEDEVWEAAFGHTAVEERLTLDEAAKLNRLVHVADFGDAEASERGVVVLLPEAWRTDFEIQFGIEEVVAARDQFRCRDFAPGERRFRWVLVQCHAACDHAQSRPGRRPWHLGLELPAANVHPGTPPASLWRSPALDIDDEVRHLHVSATFFVTLVPGTTLESEPTYRLREQILNDLIYHIHRHGARPGMLSF